MILTGFSFSPLIDLWILYVLGFLCFLLIFLLLMKRINDSFLRLLFLLILCGFSTNPSIIKEKERIERDIVLVIIDRTSSQNVSDRQVFTASALKSIREQSQKLKGVVFREIEIFDGGLGNSNIGLKEGSNIMTKLRQVIGKVPLGRFGGVILITDGQIHDVLPVDQKIFKNIPVHTLLTGKKHERDRVLVIDEAPQYGIVGKKVSLLFHIKDVGVDAFDSRENQLVNVTLTKGAEIILRRKVPIGVKTKFNFLVNHAGWSTFDLEVDSLVDELSPLNNHVLLKVNGIRNRLRVLLVSGQPHAGQRMWRSFLKSDVSVDLVHFTILRPPNKENFVPTEELALIPFPVRELFEQKLKSFDLVIFDRYLIRDILPTSYLQNVVDYVNQGGAIMLTVGPEFTGVRSLYNSKLSKILPARPTGGIFERGFVPKISEIGKRHPVTKNLVNREKLLIAEKDWGKWFRQVETKLLSGSVVMHGIQNMPLLILDRKVEGRVALLLSDHIWLWARGYQGGGPYAELLRRTVHWLMKEPELEEESLEAAIKDGNLNVRRTSLSKSDVKINIRRPSGFKETHLFKSNAISNKGVAIPAREIGVYSVNDGVNSIKVSSDVLNSIEMRDLRVTKKFIKMVSKASGGGIFWIEEGVPTLREVRLGRDTKGKKWVGLVNNRILITSGTKVLPLIPSYIFLVLSILILGLLWWRHSNS